MATNQDFKPVTIRLIVDLPVSPRHSLFAGQVHKTVEPPPFVCKGVVHWIMGHGSAVGVHAVEFELVADELNTHIADFNAQFDDLPF